MAAARVSTSPQLWFGLLRDRLGRGGMAALYRALQPSLDRLVAVKVLPLSQVADPTLPERCYREVRICPTNAPRTSSERSLWERGSHPGAHAMARGLRWLAGTTLVRILLAASPVLRLRRLLRQ